MKKLYPSTGGDGARLAGQFKTQLATALALVALILLLVGCAPLPPVATELPPTADLSTTAPIAAAPPPTEELRLLRANAWQWVALEDAGQRSAIETPAAYRLTFNVDATLGIAADCIAASGSYQGEGGKLEIDVTPEAWPECGPESQGLPFLSRLPAALRYTFDGDHLRIEVAGEASSSVMVFAPTDQRVAVPTAAPPAVVSPEPDATRSPGDAAANPYAARSFDLGAAVLTQDWVADEKQRDMPIRLDGMIAVPPAGDNLPIAVIIHGSHGSGCKSLDGMTEQWPCPDREQRHYAGFTELLQALAEQGYVAVSINANPAYVSAYGEPNANERLPRLFDLYMAKMAEAANGRDVGFGVDLAGRVNLSQLVALGHSAGGEALTHVVNPRAVHTTPEQIAAGQGPIAAAILLAPSTTARGGEMDAPFAVLLPACDRDVSGLAGQTYYEVARTQPKRDRLAASVYLPGMNHNRFNAELGDETLGRTSAICEATLAPAAAQRDFLANYTVHFFDAVLGRGNGDRAAAGLDPAQPAPATLFGRPVLTSLALPTPQRLRLPLRVEGATGPAAAVSCPGGYNAPGATPEACRDAQFNQPGHPEKVALTWDGSGGVYEVALPAGNRDLSGYATVHLRAAVDPLSPLNAPGQPQSFSLRLTDGAGKTAAVALTGEPALAFPAGVKGGVNSFNLDTWDNHVILSSIRVPLSAFTGVDLNDVRSVALVFDATDRGAIFVTDLELLWSDTTQTKQP